MENKTNKIYLIRHGQDIDNENEVFNGHREMSLTGLGIKQAEEASQKLKGYGIEIIISSPLKRAYQTAEIIAEGIDVEEIIKEDLLKERDFGILTGKPISDISKYTDKFIETKDMNYFLEVEGSESFPDLFERAKSLLEKINNLYSNKTILLVGHGDIGKMIRAVINGMNWEEGLKTDYIKNTEILEL